MSNRKRLSGGDDKIDINISPMIDMVFILLIFFIVTTVFVEEEGLDVDKPSPGGQSNLDIETVIFHITKNGAVMFEGREIGLSGVRATIRNKMQREVLPLILEVEMEAPSGIMIRVMDEAKFAKPNVSISINAVGK